MVCDEINTIEKELWERVKSTSIEEIREDVEEWVMEPWNYGEEGVYL